MSLAPAVTYELIDTVLLPWADERRLTVYRLMRDEPVRLLHINDDRGDLSVDPSSDGELVWVRAVKNAKRFDTRVAMAELGKALDDAYAFLKT